VPCPAVAVLFLPKVEVVMEADWCYAVDWLPS